MPLSEKITAYISKLDVMDISTERKEILQPLVDYIQSKTDKNDSIRLNFVCTHNSRRSHFAQVWAQTMAYQFKVKNVQCYSGGTESTALFPMVVQTLSDIGFTIDCIATTDNPVYGIKYAKNEQPIIGFSKKLDNSFNPSTEFAAIMTCSDADDNCPFVFGAEKRIPITYEDPKLFDGTAQQAEKYMERSRQIATELFYIFSQINK